MPDTQPVIENNHSMYVSIEIERTDSKGNKLHVSAKVNNQIDLYEINRLYIGYMPRKKFLGLF